MLLKFWHFLFGHRYTERATYTPADPDHGRPWRINLFLRHCRCGNTQTAQMMGEPVANEEELNALRRMAMMGTPEDPWKG